MSILKSAWFTKAELLFHESINIISKHRKKNGIF